MNSLQFPSKLLLLLFVFIFSAMTFNACIKDQSFFNDNLIAVGEQDNPFSDNPKEVVITNIFGSVVDENDSPIVNSEVSLNTLRGVRTTTTDEDGNFLYTKVMVVKSGALLKVRQAGKFEAFRKMNVSADSYNYTKIKLLHKMIVGSLPSIEGGIVKDIFSPAKVQLNPNSVRYESGEDYTGNVEVAMSWLDPTAEDLAERMIGDLSGIDENGKQVALGTFGMLNVELLGENGEELQLKEGMPAILTFPVPSEILPQAPPTIPLWSFDEDLGTWVEEGFATLQGDAYVGEVAHFSSWNVDTKQEPISVSGSVFVRMNDEDIVIPYLQVFVNIEGVQQAGGFLDDSGEFEFYNFPANTVFTLSVLDACGGVLWEEELGPYASDTDLGEIMLPTVGNNFMVLNGIGMDCDGEGVQEGYVTFELDDTSTIYPLNEDGSFKFIVLRCGSIEGEISLMDLENLKFTSPQTVYLFQTFTDVGVLSACDELESYVKIEIEDGPSHLFEGVTARFDSLFLSDGGELVWLKIHGVKPHPVYDYEDEIQFSAEEAFEAGIYDRIGGEWSEWLDSGGSYRFNHYKTSIEITKFGMEQGTVIRGTITGEAELNLKQTESTYIYFSGVFKAIRQ